MSRFLAYFPLAVQICKFILRIGKPSKKNPFIIGTNHDEEKESGPQ